MCASMRWRDRAPATFCIAARRCRGRRRHHRSSYVTLGASWPKKIHGAAEIARISQPPREERGHRRNAARRSLARHVNVASGQFEYYRYANNINRNCCHYYCYETPANDEYLHVRQARVQGVSAELASFHPPQRFSSVATRKLFFETCVSGTLKVAGE